MRDAKDGPGFGEVLDQDSTKVTVRVEYHGNGSIDDLVEHGVVVTLDEPLGSRIVIDAGSGQPVMSVGSSLPESP